MSLIDNRAQSLLVLGLDIPFVARVQNLRPLAAGMIKNIDLHQG